eukprot:scaffold1709_cov151-Skeletonema_menzelii.AAC.4
MKGSIGRYDLVVQFVNGNGGRSSISSIDSWEDGGPLKKRKVEGRASQWPSAPKTEEHSSQLLIHQLAPRSTKAQRTGHLKQKEEVLIT